MTSEHSEQLKKLFSHIPTPRTGKFGIGADDIARIVVTPQLVPDILDCLESKEVLDVGFALFFLQYLNSRSDFRDLLSPSLTAVTTQIRKLLSHPDHNVSIDAAGAFVAFRENFSDYSSVMSDLLASPNSEIRRIAIGASPTYLSEKNLQELLRLREDPAFHETGGMEGPLRYALRDFALEIAEHISGRSFNAGDCFEQREGRRISWRSWSVFTNWLESKKGWSLFRK